jgi:hypothetical protein
VAELDQGEGLMANTRSYARSFVGGEVTPEFFARFDDVKNQTGLQICRNAIVKAHGPATNRGGLRFIAKAKNSTTATRVRLLPFVYSNEQSVVIEVGAGYFRFFTLGAAILSGGVPYEVANPYAAADLAQLKFVQSNDVVTLTHPNYPPAELKRLAAASWTYTTITFTSKLSPPTSVSATARPATTSPGTPTLQTYVVTAVNGGDESAASGG